jgi:type VI secretion system protein ImpM
MESNDHDVVTLLGKLPDEGDFVRLGNVDANAIAIHGWLQEAVESNRGEIPNTPVRFIARYPGSDTTTVGAWHASQDRVGREFPLAIFAALDTDLHGVPFACWPTIARPFLDGADALLSAAALVPKETLTEELRRLEPPHASAAPAAWLECKAAMERLSCDEFFARVFRARRDGQPYYALQTLRAACAPLRNAPPEIARLTVDCPITNGNDTVVWLHLLHELLKWDGEAPGIFWTGKHERLLTTLGPPPPKLMSRFSGDEGDLKSLWPLWTDSPEALQAARDCAAPPLLPGTDTSSPVASLLSGLG